MQDLRMHSSLPVQRRAAPAGAPAAPRPAAWLDAVLEQREERERMVRAQIEARGIEDPRVLEALRTVPRHRFVPEHSREGAYADSPLPIAGDQTISQPYIVAFMSEAAQISPSDRCLEIGTGSGYQTAVLAELCREVYSVEYLPEVAAFGRENLGALGYLERGVHLRVGDGYEGWPEFAPYDVILVTAAPRRVPKPLLRQLALGGRLLSPVGLEREQNLELWTRRRAGDGRAAFSREILFGVRFVPFLGAHGE
ncbi:MAG TPA: protein-L-isoaspartate(D-aspartate) O-methyltransferase [Polyangiaceae bacterium]|jgi:protein-L-isoaspartate(D-aspartate) O-methyltransferase|nr:protein-L-isoaspartate(D-aspartate) O-methyltransferase [Polyangiaceae bacterium]